MEESMTGYVDGTGGSSTPSLDPTLRGDGDETPAPAGASGGASSCEGQTCGGGTAGGTAGSGGSSGTGGQTTEDVPLYVRVGDDPSFAALIDEGILPTGFNSTEGVTGSRVDVNNERVEVGPYAQRPIEQGMRIHTLANSSIPRKDFGKWTRWYQEDGNTQVFRLFDTEHNVRNDRPDAARVEAFSTVKWNDGDGEWHEWVGTYTVIQPHGCAIFQAKNNINDWGVMLNLTNEGDIVLNHRRHQDDVTIATDVVGAPFHIRVRDNGHDYEVYLDGALVGAGHYDRPEGDTVFRWGMYNGTMTSDAMLFVTGATVDP